MPGTPIVRAALVMCQGKHEQGIRSKRIQDGVRETVENPASDFTLNAACSQWSQLDTLQDTRNIVKELVSKPRALLIVEIGRFQ